MRGVLAKGWNLSFDLGQVVGRESGAGREGGWYQTRATGLPDCAEGIAVAAVLGSQFAGIAAVGGFLLFGERLQRLQVVGVVMVATGITLLSAVSS